MTAPIQMSATLRDGEKVYLVADWRGGAYIDVFHHWYRMSPLDCVNIWDYKTGDIETEFAGVRSSDRREQIKTIRNAVRLWAIQLDKREFDNYTEHVR